MSSAAEKRARIAAKYREAEEAAAREEAAWAAAAARESVAKSRVGGPVEEQLVPEASTVGAGGIDGVGVGGCRAGRAVHNDGMREKVAAETACVFLQHPKEFRRIDRFEPQLRCVPDGPAGLVRAGTDLVALSEHLLQEWDELRHVGFAVRAARLYTMFLKFRASLGSRGASLSPDPSSCSATSSATPLFWIHDVAAAAWMAHALRPIEYARDCARLFGNAENPPHSPNVDDAHVVHFEIGSVDFILKCRLREARARASVDPSDHGPALDRVQRLQADLKARRDFVAQQWLDEFGEDMDTSIQRLLYSSSASEDERLASRNGVQTAPANSADEARAKERALHENLALAVAADTKWLPHIKAYTFQVGRDAHLVTSLAKRNPQARSTVPSSVGAEWFIYQQLQNYEEFLYLAIVGDGKGEAGILINPPAPVDILWHAHMLHPLHYAESCRQLRRSSSSFLLDHVPWPDVDQASTSIQSKDLKPTLSRWVEEFGGSPEDAVFAPFGSFRAATFAVQGDNALLELFEYVDGVTLAKLRLVCKDFAKLIDSVRGNAAWVQALRRDFNVKGKSLRDDVRALYRTRWLARRDMRNGHNLVAGNSSDSEDEGPSLPARLPRPRPFPVRHPRPQPTPLNIPIQRPYMCGAPENVVSSDCCLGAIVKIVETRTASLYSAQRSALDMGLGLDVTNDDSTRQALVADVSAEVDELVTASRGMFMNQIEEKVTEALSKRGVGTANGRREESAVQF